MRLQQTTAVPNEVFDEYLPQLKGDSELKPYLFILRKTIGWRKVRDRITHSQFESTNLSRRAIIDGIKNLEDMDLIAVTDRSGYPIPRNERKGRSDIFYTPFTKRYAQKCRDIGTFVTEGVQKMTHNKSLFGKPNKQNLLSPKNLHRQSDQERIKDLIHKFQIRRG